MRYEFTENVFVDPIRPENPAQGRILATKGTVFNTTEKPEIVIDKTGKEPKEVATGRKVVVSSDTNILPGCLTSCIRTGRAKAIGESEKQPAQTAGKK